MASSSEDSGWWQIAAVPGSLNISWPPAYTHRHRHTDTDTDTDTRSVLVDEIDEINSDTFADQPGIHENLTE